MSRDPLAYFGLAADADARAVKRAYAQRLKQTRPDVDPAGFQALHDAYQHALAWCAHRDQADAMAMAVSSPSEADGDTAQAQRAVDRPLSLAGAPVAERAPTALEPDAPVAATDIRFDLDALLGQLVGHAVDGTPQALAHWLREQPVLWSLATKPVVGDATLHTLHRQALTVSPESFDVLADFFEWHQLGNGIDPMYLRRLRHAFHLSWMLRLSSPAVLGRFLRGYADAEITDAGADKARKQLVRPFSRWQALLASLQPMWPTRLHRALRALEALPGRAPVAPLAPAQARFWFDAGDTSRLSWPRVQVGATRCVAITLLLFLILLAGLQGEAASTSGIRLSNALSISTAIGVWLVGGWAVWLLAGTLFRWLVAPEQPTVRWPWARLALGPVLLGAGAIAMAFPSAEVAASWLAASGTILCVMRLAYRWPRLGRMPAWLWPIVLVGARMAAVVPSQIRWLLLAGAVAWIADGARHWRALRSLATGRA